MNLYIVYEERCYDDGRPYFVPYSYTVAENLESALKILEFSKDEFIKTTDCDRYNFYKSSDCCYDNYELYEYKNCINKKIHAPSMEYGA